MVTVYVVAPNRDLTSEEIDEVLEFRKEVLHYGRPTRRQVTGPGRIHLSGEISKLATKTEEDAQRLRAELQAQFGFDSTISPREYDDEIRWEADETE